MGLAQKVMLNASALAAGRFAMAGISLVTVAISTRYLGLDAFGQLSTATALMAIVGALNDLGIWTIGARELARRPHEKDRLISGILTVGLVFSAIGGAAGVLCAFTLYGGSDDEPTRQAILLLLLTLPLSAPVGAIGAWFNSQQKAYLGVIGTMAASVVTLAIVATAAWLDLGFTGLVLAYPAASFVQGAVMIALAWGEVRLRPTFDRALVKQLLKWAMPVGGALIVHQLYWRIDVVLLSGLSSHAAVGLYALGYKIIDVAMGLPSYVHVTVMPELVRAAQDRPRFDSVMTKTCTLLVTVAGGLVVLFVAYAEEMTRIAGGSAFMDATAVVQILAVALGFAWYGSMFGNAFFVRDKLGFSLVVGLVVLPLNVALNIPLIQLWDANGAAAAWALSEIAIVLVYAYFYRRMFGPLPRPDRAAGIAGAVVVMAAIAAATKLLVPVDDLGPVVVAVAGGAVCSAVYVACLYAFGAMPPELHTNVIRPVVMRLRPRRPVL